MSQFECSMKDLNGKNVEYKTARKEQNESANVNANVNANSNVNANVNANVNENANENLNSEETIVPKNETIDVNTSLLDKIKEEKNIKTILLIIIAYIITSSSQFNDILVNSFPYLIENGSTNLLGKVVIAVLIGLSVVLFTSFFQDH